MVSEQNDAVELGSCPTCGGPTQLIGDNKTIDEYRHVDLRRALYPRIRELRKQRDAYKEAADSALDLVTTNKFTYDEKESMNGLVTKLGERISELTEQNRLLVEDCQGEEEK